VGPLFVLVWIFMLGFLKLNGLFGKLQLNLEEVDLSEVLENILLRTKMKVRNKGISIYLTNENNHPFIYGDGNRLEQIFLNLIENAIRYTEVGSIIITITHADWNVIVSLKDTGIGIPQKDFILISIFLVVAHIAMIFGMVDPSILDNTKEGMNKM
jgi:signal transduction histidine kinase